MLEQAIKKIDKELKEFNAGSKETAVSRYVADTLKSFCIQEPEFAQAIVQNDKTLSDCCKEMKGVGQAISISKSTAGRYSSISRVRTSGRICESTSGICRIERVDNIINLSLDDLID